MYLARTVNAANQELFNVPGSAGAGDQYHRARVFVDGPGGHGKHLVQIRKQPVLGDYGDVNRRQKRD